MTGPGGCQRPHHGRGGAGRLRAPPCIAVTSSRLPVSLRHALPSCSLSIPSRCPRRRDWCWPASPAAQRLRFGGASRSCCLWELLDGTSLPQASSICAFIHPGRCPLGGVTVAGLRHRRRHGRSSARRGSAPPALAAIASGYLMGALPCLMPSSSAVSKLARARAPGSRGGVLDGVCNRAISCHCARRLCICYL